MSDAEGRKGGIRRKQKVPERLLRSVAWYGESSEDDGTTVERHQKQEKKATELVKEHEKISETLTVTDTDAKNDFDGICWNHVDPTLGGYPQVQGRPLAEIHDPVRSGPFRPFASNEKDGRAAEATAQRQQHH